MNNIRIHGDNMSTERASIEEVLQLRHAIALTEQPLTNEPMQITNSARNAVAVARTLELASFYYDEAYPCSHRSFDLDETLDVATDSSTVNLAVGAGNQLQAGVILQVPRALPGDFMGLDVADPVIHSIYRLPKLNMQHVGKLLLGASIDYVRDANRDILHTTVVSNNHTAREVLEAAGFVMVSRSFTNGRSHKLIHMVLSGKDNLAKASDRLKELAKVSYNGMQDE